MELSTTFRKLDLKKIQQYITTMSKVAFIHVKILQYFSSQP
jgi:hypothetical protein